MRKTFVISGAGGMTGLELVKQLPVCFPGCSVIGFDNGFNCDLDKAAKLNSSNVVLHLGEDCDITNSNFMELLESILTSYQDTDEMFFINCAAVVHTKHFYVPSETFDTNVIGMRNFLEMAIRVGAKSFINCSTSEVYSSHSYVEGGVKEDDILQMYTAEHSLRTSYAMGKLLTEHFLREAVDKGLLTGASIRFANVYAEDELEAEHILPLLVKANITQEPAKLTQNATYSYRTFLNNYDSCQAVICLLRNYDKLHGEAYNVGTTEEYHILEIPTLITHFTGNKTPYEITEETRSADPTRRVLNTERIQSLGWLPQISLEEGIQRLIRNYSKRYGK